MGAPSKVVRNIVGGVLSPLLSNAFLHEVLDEWFERTVKPRLSSTCADSWSYAAGARAE